MNTKDFDLINNSSSVTNAIGALRTHYRRYAHVAHPDGSFDSAGRFFLSEYEECECCKYIRYPTTVFPSSYSQHARSLAHCESLHEADHNVVCAVRRALVKSTGVEAKSLLLKDEAELQALLCQALVSKSLSGRAVRASAPRARI